MAQEKQGKFSDPKTPAERRERLPALMACPVSETEKGSSGWGLDSIAPGSLVASRRSRCTEFWKPVTLMDRILLRMPGILPLATDRAFEWQATRLPLRTMKSPRSDAFSRKWDRDGKMTVQCRSNQAHAGCYKAARTLPGRALWLFGSMTG